MSEQFLLVDFSYCEPDAFLLALPGSTSLWKERREDRAHPTTDKRN